MAAGVELEAEATGWVAEPLRGSSGSWRAGCRGMVIRGRRADKRRAAAMAWPRPAKAKPATMSRLSPCNPRSMNSVGNPVWQVVLTWARIACKPRLRVTWTLSIWLEFKTEPAPSGIACQTLGNKEGLLLTQIPLGGKLKLTFKRSQSPSSGSHTVSR